VRVDGPHPGEEWNDGAVTEPRQAASIVVLRDSADGPEVLLVQRNPEQRFMGGAWVFPGGAVHADDSDHAAAAVRELQEEAGVQLAADHPIVGWSRWITPAEVVVRFDTWFFVTGRRSAPRPRWTAPSASTPAGCAPPPRWRRTSAAS
jgi:8-oxo-dGTP pyrophosphatase MutT (NUDIX family)